MAAIIARIDTVLLAPADPLDGLLLEVPQDLHLQRQRQLPDLVEEKRPLVGRLDAPLAQDVGPREGALLVAEEFALQQRLRDGPAVDHHEGASPAPAELVNGQGDELLARAALARDQDGHVAVGHLAHGRKDFLYPGAGPQHPFEGLLAQPMLHLGVFPFKGRDVVGPLQDRAQLVELNRLVEDVVGPLGDRFQGVLLLGAARDDDDLDIGIGRNGLGEGGKALLGAGRVGRQAQVQDHDPRLVRPDGRHRLGPVPRRQDLVVPRHGPLHLRPHILVVFNNQKLELLIVERVSGRGLHVEGLRFRALLFN